MGATKFVTETAFREILAVTLVTGVGFLLRIWPPGRLGLTHFDEGIYCFAATWSLSATGLSGIDPMLIPYAPPGYPILVGGVYSILGVFDGAAILVSQMAGTTTIPVVAWLARRASGPGAGCAAAILVALSGPHIAFSRMALTDSSFLLAWLIAVGMGIRFLERPGPARAIGLGIAVGLAQQFKYNGWLTGGIVIATALVGVGTQVESRRASHLVRTFGWGFLAAGVAALVVLPWFIFVENHGGYAALLRHQRSYLGGAGNWLAAFHSQEVQAVTLSGSKTLVTFAWLIAAIGASWLRFRPFTNWLLPRRIYYQPILAMLLCVSFVEVIPDPAWWVGLAFMPWLVGAASTGTRFLGVWWLILSVMTPFYHPYARLWLPIHAAGWIIGGGLLSRGTAWLSSLHDPLSGMTNSTGTIRGRIGWRVAWLVAVGVLCASTLLATPGRARAIPGLLAPSDSLRHAASRVVSSLPAEVTGLRFLGRPSLRFYLAASRINLLPQSGTDPFFSGTDRQVWALLDEAVLPADHSILSDPRWELVESFPTDLALPTLLDRNPSAGLTARGQVSSRTVQLRLFRPRSLSRSR